MRPENPDSANVLAKQRECLTIRGQAILLGALAEMAIGSRNAPRQINCHAKSSFGHRFGEHGTYIQHSYAGAKAVAVINIGKKITFHIENCSERSCLPQARFGKIDLTDDDFCVGRLGFI